MVCHCKAALQKACQPRADNDRVPAPELSRLRWSAHWRSWRPRTLASLACGRPHCPSRTRQVSEKSIGRLNQRIFMYSVLSSSIFCDAQSINKPVIIQEQRGSKLDCFSKFRAILADNSMNLL